MNTNLSLNGRVSPSNAELRSENMLKRAGLLILGVSFLATGSCLAGGDPDIKPELVDASTPNGASNETIGDSSNASENAMGDSASGGNSSSDGDDSFDAVENDHWEIRNQNDAPMIRVATNQGTSFFSGSAGQFLSLEHNTGHIGIGVTNPDTLLHISGANNVNLLKLDDKDLLKGKKFNVRIKKNIPQKSGLGGGSMNAANILNYLMKKRFIKLSQNKIRDICSSIGSDVILGIDFSSCILLSNNKIKKFYSCPKYFPLLVRPNFGCSTQKIYSSVRKFTKPEFSFPKKYMFYSNYLINQKNALEEIAFKKYIKLKKIVSFLAETNNPIFVRMTGSGSVIIAYYNSMKNCKLAKAKFRRKYKNYWCITSKTI